MSDAAVLADANARAESMARKLAKLRDPSELPRFAAETLKILDKDGKLVPFRFNRTQLFCHAALEKQRKEIGKVRHIFGKGRQGGVSTMVAGRFFQRTTLHRGISTYIMTHEGAATDTLFEMVERFYAHTSLKPQATADNAKELVFGLLDSSYAVGTAGAKAGGRSQTTRLLHWSEVAWSANAKGHFAGIVQTVPDRDGTEIILESTGNGPSGEYFERVQQALAGRGDYRFTFAPWYWTEDYARAVPPGWEPDEEEREYQRLYRLRTEQMVWRRAKISEMRDAKLFAQEYPAHTAEMFSATAQAGFIDPESIIRARQNTCEGIGSRVVGVDPARFGDDRFSVASRVGRKVEWVKSRSKIGTMEAVAWLRDILDNEREYVDMLFIDTGGGGDRIYDILESWGYGSRMKLINFGGKPHTEVIVERDGTKRAGPANRRSEMWMNSKVWLEQEGGVDLPLEDSLMADACAPRFSYRLTDQALVIESKEALRARGIRSPDEWDAVILTLAEPVRPRRIVKAPPPRPMESSSGPSASWLGT